MERASSLTPNNTDGLDRIPASYDAADDDAAVSTAAAPVTV
jgi:hypothetical protein